MASLDLATTSRAPSPERRVLAWTFRVRRSDKYCAAIPFRALKVSNKILKLNPETNGEPEQGVQDIHMQLFRSNHLLYLVYWSFSQSPTLPSLVVLERVAPKPIGISQGRKTDGKQFFKRFNTLFLVVRTAH